MNPERWGRLQDIAWSALGRAEGDRAAFVRGACAGEADLEAEVLAILAHITEESDFLERPVAVVSGLDEAEASGDATRRVGPYRLVRPIGSGGMGEVYLAIREGDGFEMPVAIKVMRAGSQSEGALARFREERRILASLRHPNIARLIDGGTAQDGRPYLVMEYVDGTAIDEYVRRRSLSLADRVRLMVTVCEAVQHAHQNLIVHRDLKPTNVLVSPEGAPKLLDFGIGKSLFEEGDREWTRTDVHVLTPAYAAPEQMRGEVVTTAADVYGLGILLYVVLTGSHPWALESGTYGALESAILTRDPPAPSATVARAGTGEPARLARALRGDLDTIVLEAMRRRPEDRYATARELAEDLTRHLEGRPVRARPPSVGYRLGRFVRRRAWAVTTASTLVAALLGAVILEARQSRRIADERDKALEVQSFLLESFGTAGADRGADAVTARQLLDGQASRLRTDFRDQPELRADMLEVLAQGYDRLGLQEVAQGHAEEALALRRRVLGEDHPDVASALALLGWIRHGRGESMAAESLLVAAVSLGRRQGRDYRPRLARALNDLGVVQQARGEYGDAAATLGEALTLREQLYGTGHRAYAITASNVAANLFYLGDYAAAADMSARVVHALETTLGPDHERTVIALNNLAAIRAAGGDDAGAEEVLRDLVGRSERLFGPEDPRTFEARATLVVVILRQGRAAEAEALARRAVALVEATRGPDHPDLAPALSLLGTALARQGSYDEGEVALRRSIAIQRAAFGDARFELTDSWLSLAALLRDAGRADAAEEAFRSALASAERTLGAQHPTTIGIRLDLAAALIRSERWATATEELAGLAGLELSDAQRARGDSLRAVLDGREVPEG